MYLIFDTETTGLPRSYDAPLTQFDNWPRMVQLAWQLHDKTGKLLSVQSYLIKPDGFDIPFNASKVHGISTEIARQEGRDITEVLDIFMDDLQRSEWICGHNVEFDIHVAACEMLRLGREDVLSGRPMIDSNGEKTARLCQLPGGRGGKFKFPKLTELHWHLFDENFSAAHNAAADVEATARCMLELIRTGVFTAQEVGLTSEELETFREVNPDKIAAIGLNTKAYKPSKPIEIQSGDSNAETTQIPCDPSYNKPIEELSFVHLHNHSRYSVLQSTTDLNDLTATAKALQMPAVALTDAGNLFAAYEFLKVAAAEGIKPILGCEVMMAEKYQQLQFTREAPDQRYPVVLLARNKQGYHHLVKIVSEGFLKGYYSGIPRVGFSVAEKFSGDLICLIGGLRSEVGFLALNVGEQQAEECILKWHKVFGEDFYLELIDHGLEEEKHLNRFLVKMAHKHQIKAVASNDTYYVRRSDSEAHDILLCIKDGEKKSVPIGRGRGFRNGMSNNSYYLKSIDEMKQIFSAYPQAIANTIEVADKIEAYQLGRKPVLPKFQLPDGFDTESDYLKYLTYEGAHKRYGTLTDNLCQRLDYELKVINESGFPGYFLIVQDFTTQARNMGVWVGPGRGSAAGSAVAYCIGITNIDPIQYKLLFERFLNPDRVSMPDIDIDFDDEGRARIMEWVVNKYGKSQVAQIITYGTMGAKSALRDVARVMDVPLEVVNKLCAAFPDHLDASLDNVLAEGGVHPKLKDKLNEEQRRQANDFREIAAGKDERAALIAQAVILEGSLRNTGVHACGVIIAPDDLTQYVPLSTSREDTLPVTQFDKDQVEQVGLLKMDFLGLKTLTIIKDAIENIKLRHGIEINPDQIPMDDARTFELYQRGQTNGTFQFESDGMQKHLRNLKPTNIEDLVAMNALFRPGPMQYIDSFIRRKRGAEAVEYPHPLLEEILSDTFGIMVYQEQIMQTAQIIGGFTLGQADILRRAMGKKKEKEMQSMLRNFVEGAASLHDLSEPKATEIFETMSKFAQYGFNRSHSAAYSVVAFQTGYLKANYPSEYMASVLSNNMSDLKKVTFYMDECRRLGIKVLPPDINESRALFSVNSNGEIRFALSAVKGVGEGVVANIVEEREARGKYTSCFDFVGRLEQKSVNKKTLEALVMAGAFDSLEGVNRAQYFHDIGGVTFIDRVLKYGQSIRNEAASSQISLFGNAQKSEIKLPQPPPVIEWDLLDKLEKERSVIGIYISGHPLDRFKPIIQSLTTPGFHLGILQTEEISDWAGKIVRFCCLVNSASHKAGERGKPYATVDLEDYEANQMSMWFFGTNYMNFKAFLEKGYFLSIEARISFSDRKKEYEPIPQKIELLSELHQKIKEVQVTIDPQFLQKDTLDLLTDAIGTFKGKTRITIHFNDNKAGVNAEFAVPHRTVECDDRFIDILDNLNFTYKLVR